MPKGRNAGKRGCGNREEVNRPEGGLARLGGEAGHNQWREERVWMVCPLLCTSHEESSSLLDHVWQHHSTTQAAAKRLVSCGVLPNAQLYSESSPASVGN
ncbi:hypothetical protein SISSUDRAFT_1050019 [Sistotremastrum suecicum HHB10207 ss-3]|uniref:Uncharacterized protein n=1 Tax=Sistotremastrum suecicum HHB10207 ss-3 TaxID=1314776 RepID=A0A166BG27_9AGAM|nr:hypothetical protein SISSUDRAFT_1050019 [Sistotremastrum suecicum HHB10207 ss-3]